VSPVRTVSLLTATLTMGLAAGVFALHAYTIMPGPRATDDRTFVAAFQSIDRAIINPWLLAGTFVGALALAALAVVTTWDRSALPWVIAALALHAASW
jgi:uncharacterized membrane protein